MDGRDEFTEDSECCSNNSQEVQEQDSISGTGWSDGTRRGTGQTLWDVPGLRGVSESKPCSVFCCLSVCIDRAVFASIEDSDSDPDHHGEDSSSNTSADDHMSTKRSQCCLQGAGVKEVRGRPSASDRGLSVTVLCHTLCTLFIITLQARHHEVRPLTSTCNC